MAKRKNNPRYEMIISWSDEDKAFIAAVTELLGCAAHENSDKNDRSRPRARGPATKGLAVYFLR
jgi:hypothetical protein